MYMCYTPFQEFVEYTTKREPVSSEGILDTFLDNLWSHVAMCATNNPWTNQRNGTSIWTETQKNREVGDMLQH